MIDSFGTWNLIKLILEKLVCFFVFSVISAVLLINSGLEYCLSLYLLNAMKVSIWLRILLEGRQWRGGRASRGWTQAQLCALRGAATQPSPSFHLAPTWPPEVELSSLPGPGPLCPPILFPSGPTSHFANGSNSGLDLTLSEGNPSAGGGHGVGCTSHGVT